MTNSRISSPLSRNTPPPVEQETHRSSRKRSRFADAPIAQPAAAKPRKSRFRDATPAEIQRSEPRPSQARLRRSSSSSSSGSEGSLGGGLGSLPSNERRGGHTIKNHVGKSQQELSQRAEDKSRTSDKGYAKASSWKSTSDAKKDLRETLQPENLRTDKRHPSGDRVQTYWKEHSRGGRGSSVSAHNGKANPATGTGSTGAVVTTRKGEQPVLTTGYPTAGKKDANKPPNF